MNHPARQGGFSGPRAWAASALIGALAGWGLTVAAPAAYVDAAPIVPAWLVIPFAALLGSIAVLPFAAPRFWHAHYPDVSFFLGAVVATYYLVAFRTASPGHAMGYGAEKMLHAAEEFYAFIALVGGLYIVSGGILIEVRGKGRPLINTALLAVGAILANVVGTTGASMLLIMPFMRLNAGRLRPLHIVFFIFIVSNCGGCLTPIGDPPLYLGFIKGVPFFWTLKHLWRDWAFMVGALLALFYIADQWIEGSVPPTTGVEGRGISIKGRVGLACLGLMLVGVFLPILLKPHAGDWAGVVGATFQIAVAAAAHRLAPTAIREANSFTFGPVKEVGLLFAGIFATMAPALGYLAKHGASLGISGSGEFYFGTGSLSALLDNAPTYMSFFQIAFGQTEITTDSIRTFISAPSGVTTLHAISTGAVFFGAMTYIGNGPNFMVKSIAESAKVKMPGFFGYFLLAAGTLLPVLILHWVIYIR